MDLIIRLVMQSGHELHIPLWKNALEINVVLVLDPGNLRDKPGGVQCGLPS